MSPYDIYERNDSRAQDFQQALWNDLSALQFMLDHGLVEDSRRKIGAGQEMYLVDRGLRPAAVSRDVLEWLNHPQFTTRTGKFDIQVNLSTRTFTGRCLHDMESEASELLALARLAVRNVGAEILLGETPRTAADDLIDPGQEGWRQRFQVHFQVSPAGFAPAYNLIQMITAPVLAAAMNSMLPGQSLRQETRIATLASFGDGWLDHSMVEIFREELARVRVTRTDAIQEDAREVLARGGIPSLEALRLHNNTLRRWNRPCYSVTDGEAHLGIEAHILPAGPSVLDEIANAGFLVGLLMGMQAEYSDIRYLFPFESARENFYLAARHGLGATLSWLGGRRLSVTKLVLSELLPLARAGLRQAGIAAEDIGRYLGTVEERIERRRSASQWAFQSLDATG